MDHYKFCFIICANNEQFLEEGLLYINNLIVPEGYMLETLILREADSILSAYNYGAHSSDAKYKIYLHQDLFILNKNILKDVLNIFMVHPEVGMIGVIGCQKIPESGVWWEGKLGYGDAYQDCILSTQRTQGLPIEDDSYQVVQVVDGIIMITQYDIKWREDILKGWHYYDASQCLEYSRAGYKVVIPHQTEPWCLHDGNIGVRLEEDEDYMNSRRVFLQEYAGEIGI
jgi:hypothetical protein